MSSTVPKREVGDGVRVMNTKTGQDLGLANRTGEVTGVVGPAQWGGEIYWVLIDGEDEPRQITGATLAACEPKFRDRA